MDMLPLLDLSPEQLAAWLAERGQPKYRAGQVRRWFFGARADSFAQMSDLPKPLRDELTAAFTVWTTRVAAHCRSSDGSEKLLLELADGQSIECVLLRDDREHLTACVSSQVGCGMGCAFCATGIDGLLRNLTSGEIIEQLLRLDRLAADRRLTHVVVMGMGEPLANLGPVLAALDAATAPDGLGISVRRITISTVGLPQGIRRLAEQNCQYHLAISLHAADDELRNRLVPANRQVGVAAIMAAAAEYFAKTGRRVTFEYVLLAGVNDRPPHAARLAALLKGRGALVNLIPYNRVAGLPFHTPSPAATAHFVEMLQRAGINVVCRHRKGDRIEAACGQLRRQGKAECTAEAQRRRERQELPPQ
jgi:23S rRNA (adenine2503-C2)-methyltransferase